jgi:hypothetical protein
MSSIENDMTGGTVEEQEQYYRSPDGKFWWENTRGEWIGRPPADFKLKLKAEGCNTSVMDGEKMSALERRFLLVSAENGVDYAGLISGWKPGYYERDGTRYLINREIPPLSLADDFVSLRRSAPTLARLISGLFNGYDDDDHTVKVRQSDLILGWWRHAYINYNERDGDMGLRGLALVLAGDAGCGKTLLKEFIRLSLGGKEAQPYRWFTGQEQFNGNLMQSPLWTVDDEQADTGIKARNHFGAKIKLCVANAGVPFRAMQRDELTLYPFRRIIVCVNREPERLMVLPPLVSDVVDKMLVLKCYNNKLAAGLRRKSDHEKALFFQQAVKELPHFLFWLVNVWKVPGHMAGRFGVPHYCHHEIERELFTLSPNQRLWDMIVQYVKHTTMKHQRKWSGGAQMLCNGMNGESSPLSDKEKRDVPKSNWLGSKLKELQKQYPDAIEFKRGHSTNEWSLDLRNYIDDSEDYNAEL